MNITRKEAVKVMKKLHKNGFLVGYSSGAVVAGLLKIAEKLEKGNIVVIFPDNYERYLSVKI